MSRVYKHGSYPEGSDTQDRKDNVLGIRKRERVSSYSAFAYLIYSDRVVLGTNLEDWVTTPAIQ